MSVKERLKTYIKFEKISALEFEKSINASNGYINNISKSIGLEKLELIIENYSMLNIEWLLTGKGEMLKKDSFVGDSKDSLNDIGQEINDPGFEAFLKYLDRDASAKKIIGIIKKWNENKK